MRVPALAGALCLLGLFAGCGSHGGAHSRQSRLPGSGRPPVTLATKNFTEQFVLGQLYAQALEARGYRVELKNDVGSSEIVDRALVAGAIDMYPEYTGVIAEELAGDRRRPRSARETYERAKAFEERRGFTLLHPTPGFDTDANVVRPGYARRYHLESTADLRRVGPFRYGGPPENRTRFQGAVGMRKVYGLRELRYVPLGIGERYAALDRGRVDVVAGFTTEAQLTRTSRYRLLSDPRRIFGFQNIVPVVSRRVLRAEGPAFSRTIDAVSAKLTNPALRRMNAEVDLRRRSPRVVAADFLRRRGLR